MSTRPVERRQLVARRRLPVERRLEWRRVLLMLLPIAAAFGIGLLAGRTKATPALTERPLPSLAPVATPVAASLETVPPLETGALHAPPPRRAPAAREFVPPVTGGTTATSPSVTTPATITPTTSAPAPVENTAPAPVEHTAPAPVEHTAPAPAKPAPSSHGGGSGSSGSGTSFESSD